MASDQIAGAWYPPKSSRAVPATLGVREGQAAVTGEADGGPLVVGTLDGLNVSSRVGSIPRRITFRDGSLFETSDNDAVDSLLMGHGGLTVRAIYELERFHLRLVLFVGLAILLAAVIYRYAVPAMVEVAVALTPPVAPQLMSRGVLASLDQTVFSPSKVEAERQKRISEDFRSLATLTEKGVDGYSLQFRQGGIIGPNALALPDGTIIVTDELMALADDETVLGVLGHEIGHVVHEHSLRRLYRAAGVSALIMLIGGDIGSGMEDVLMQGSALLTLSYSREQETDADRYSVELMARAGRDPAAIVRFFEIMRDRLGDEGPQNFLSTHPATVDRIEKARRYVGEIGN
ncbi:metalloprotease [Brucella endophytica]|uniref:Metalloprotease n=1 Tax=Brucella endophytica TaxID=1963359 RepID=A0A916WJA5_9HYPH|nr:M48 family metallopeptidase [Brucella endophytica]GGB05329.1 metalloprotease [Brucella endophytica]